MRRLLALGLVAIIPATLFVRPASAQTAMTTTTGSTGCTAVTQAAIDGMNSRIQADDTSINAPKSVKTLSCLDNFFSGVGLNLVSNFINPTTLLSNVEGQVCNMLQSTWSATLGSAQCGLTITGFNLGFGGLGGGLSCPKLSFGGGGPPIGTIGLGTASGSGLYINGSGTMPSGYSAANLPAGSL